MKCFQLNFTAEYFSFVGTLFTDDIDASCSNSHGRHIYFIVFRRTELGHFRVYFLPKTCFLDKVLILEFLLGLGVLFTIDTGNKVHIAVKIRGYGGSMTSGSRTMNFQPF